MDESLKNIPCIILAGGFGSRLQSVVKDVAKPMAPVGNKPFLHILMDYLHQEGIENFVLSLGYKAETVSAYFEKLSLPYAIQYIIENEPLGTGGGIKKALQALDANEFLVVNGDTFFQIPIAKFIQDAQNSAADFFMALMENKNTNRFGSVRLDNELIVDFGTPQTDGLNNAGVYFLKKAEFLIACETDKFSLETEIFPKLIRNKQLKAKCYEAYFIDIGIPEDYQRAKNELGKIRIDQTWTLFLDRDGVINQRIVGEYVKSIDEFHFIPGSLASIARFSELFGRIVVVTNQQGIGKGIMTARNLEEIHRYMQSEIEKHGGKIDAVYFAPQLSSENSEMRKPNTGMAHQAKRDFPEIDFSKSVLIGDSDSDIIFGQKLGMITVKLDNVDPSTSRATCKRSDLAACVELFEATKQK
jgi:D-glycero-alpha-D-manno-heptose 1-phosphate guanylyltransferase